MEYKAEIFDRMQWLYEATLFNDHQVHCEIGFGSAPDETLLRRAVALSLEVYPVLATRYASRRQIPAWESIGGPDLERAFSATDDEAVYESERTYRIREELGPQVRFCLLGGKRHALAVTMNHMVADGSGFKDYLYSVCETYSRLLADPGYEPPPAAAGDRGLGEVLRGLGLGAKAAALLGAGGASNRAGSFAFPLSGDGNLKPIIATRTISREKVARLRKFRGERGATLNDAALAAFYRVLARRLGPSALSGLEIPIMIDMRRYLPAGEPRPLRNLASTAITRVRQEAGESFEATMLRTKANVDALKRKGIGLGGVVKLALLFSILGEVEASRRLARGLKNPLICMTNVGELDPKRLAFEGTSVESAYLCGSIKHKPHFQLAVCGFDGTITLSSNLYGSEADDQTIRAFLGEVEEELS